MVKLAIVSDLHLEFRSFAECLHLRNEMINSGVDAVINAGDFHPSPDVRQMWENGITPSVRYLSVDGNHDYYYSRLQDCHWTTSLPGGLRVSGATLWTDFRKGDPLVMMNFAHYMYDGKAIKSPSGMLVDRLYDLHQVHLKYIAEKKPTVVVTHHAPSYLSVPPEFSNQMLQNYYFFSDLDEFILDNPNIKLWIHGHIHSSSDYMIGDTRVVCNPLCYPQERSDVSTYKPLIVEV